LSGVTTGGAAKSHFNFDGVDDAITGTVSANLSALWAGGATVAYWCRPETAGETSNGAIIHTGTTAGLNGWGIRQSTDSVEFRPYFIKQNATGTTSSVWEVTDGTGLPFNEWYFVVVRYDSDSAANDATIYVNNVAQAVTEVFAGVAGAYNDTGNTLRIGDFNAHQYAFDGDIDAIYIWDRQLSNEEIAYLYNTQKSRFEPSVTPLDNRKLIFDPESSIVSPESNVYTTWAALAVAAGKLIADGPYEVQVILNTQDHTVSQTSTNFTNAIFRGRARDRALGYSLRFSSNQQVFSNNAGPLEVHNLSMKAGPSTIRFWDYQTAGQYQVLFNNASFSSYGAASIYVVGARATGVNVRVICMGDTTLIQGAGSTGVHRMFNAVASAVVTAFVGPNCRIGDSTTATFESTAAVHDDIIVYHEAGTVIDHTSASDGKWTSIFNGSPKIRSTTAKTATFRARSGETHLVNTSGGAVTANLPPVVEVIGRIAFKLVTAGNNFIIDGNASETIDGATTLTLSNSGDTVILESDGTKWYRVGGDANAFHDNVVGEIALLTTKTTPTSADLLLIEDAAASNSKKSITVGALPRTGAMRLSVSGLVTGANVTGTVGILHIMNTNGADRTYTLPAGPADGDRCGVQIMPASGDGNIVDILGALDIPVNTSAELRFQVGTNVNYAMVCGFTFLYNATRSKWMIDATTIIPLKPLV